MFTLLAVAARKSGWSFLSFLVVVALLALTAGLPAKLRDARESAANLGEVAAALSRSTPAFEEDARVAVAKADAELQRLHKAGNAEFDLTEAELARRKRMAQRQVLITADLRWAALRGQSGRIIGSYRAQYVDLPLAEQALQMIASRRTTLSGVESRSKRIERWKGDVANYNRHATRSRRIKRELDRLRQQEKAEWRTQFALSSVLPSAKRNEQSSNCKEHMQRNSGGLMPKGESFGIVEVPSRRNAKRAPLSPTQPASRSGRAAPFATKAAASPPTLNLVSSTPLKRASRNMAGTRR